MPASPRLVLVANARMPSQRAQSLQIAQVAAAFERAGAETTLLHARRTHTPALPAGQDVFDYYAVGAGPKPRIEALPCADWIDRVPRKLQFLPARLQELTFARNAARRVRRDFADAYVLSREIETARALVRSGHGRVFLEIHRVPGGDTRRRWLREAASGVRGLVAISGGVAEDLRDYGATDANLRVEHDGLEASRFEGLPGRAAARAELGLEADARVVVYTGGLLPWKGVEVLVDAARELTDATFVVAGGMDADVERLRAYAGGLANVRFDGFQPPERVGLYLAAGDVGVVPNRSKPEISARYTSPLKVFEAMGAGLPLVASDLPSLRDILEAERDAVLVAPDDPAALAAGLRRVLEDEELRERLATRARRRAPEHTWDARARRLLDWMHERVGEAA